MIARKRPDPSEAVGRVALGYVDRERGYLTASVTAMTLAGGASVAERAALVLDAHDARRVVEHLLVEQAAQQDTLEFALPCSTAGLEVGDAVAVAGQGEGPFEVTAIRDGDVRRVSARAIPPAIEVVVEGDSPRAMVADAPARAVPVLVAAHLAGEAGAASQLVIAASSSPWPGRVAVNEELSGAPIALLERSAAIGALVEPLDPGPIAMWDMANAVVVTLLSGHLSSLDYAAVLAGANRIAIETDAGWEIVGFVVAALESPGTYRLTRLLRGQLGTDFAMTGADAGARVIVLDGRPAALDVPATWLGDTVELRAYAGSSDPDGTLVEAEIGLGPILPLAPVHLSAIRDGAGDIGFGWVRRSRADSGSWAPAESPHDNLPEAYRLTILDGPATVREVDVSTPGATYSAAEQAADFGSPPESFAFTVRQLSPVYGPGHAASGAFHG